MNAQEIKIIRKFCKYENLPFKAVKKEFKQQNADEQKKHLAAMKVIIEARKREREESDTD